MTELPDFKVVELTKKERKLLERSHHEINIKVNDRVTLKRAEVFAFRDWEEGDILFDIRAIKNAIISNGITFIVLEMKLDKVLVERALTRGGVDKDYVDNDVRNSDIDEPTITVLWPDGQGSLINGNHRIVRRYNKGLKTIRCIVIPHKEEWQRYADFGEDIPLEARVFFAGLPKDEEEFKRGQSQSN